MSDSKTTTVGKLSIASVQDGSSLRLRLSGEAELREPNELSTALLGVHERAVKDSLTQVNVDFREVAFMNSSALGAFLKWFNALRGSEYKYRVGLFYDTGVRWQRGSITALGSFAVEWVSATNLPRADALP